MSTPEPPPFPSGDNDPQIPGNNPGGYPPPPPPQYGAPQPGMPGVAPGSSKATTSLITGIIGLFCCGLVLGPIAIITGKQATAEAAAAGMAQPGNAKAGIILGWVAVALFVLTVVVYGALFATGAMTGSFEPPATP